MRKLTITLVVLLIAVVSVSAQVNRIGLRAGMNFSTINASNSIEQEFVFPDAKNKLMGTFGFYSEKGKNDYLVTQIGLFYQGKGIKSGGIELGVHYFQVPLTWYFRIPLTEEMKLRAGFGGYAAYAVMAKVEEPGFSSTDIMGWDNDKIINPLDLGIIFGGGFEYILPNGKAIELAANYQLGTWNIHNDMKISFDEEDNSLDFETSKWRNGTLTVSVSYLFDLNKE
ncbi:MAG: porin family protein [Bacteroidales bacterium]|nr:porin family protein [Bacteroidales bacterium]